MRRHLLGIIAIVLLVIGVVMFFVRLEDETYTFFQAACLRVGLVLGAIWLALPQLESMSRWLYRAVLVVAIVVAAFSRYAVILVPLLLAMWFIKPRGDKAKGTAENSST